ncbi:hypothetical protein CISIN_1g0358992mg, partial [Citrus sinensis]
RFSNSSSCGLFHSGLVVNGKLWIWGKGDGGRLGFGHEDAAFVPTLNPYLDDHVRCIALGGVHSIALTSLAVEECNRCLILGEEEKRRLK